MDLGLNFQSCNGENMNHAVFGNCLLNLSNSVNFGRSKLVEPLKFVKNVAKNNYRSKEKVVV